MKTETRNENNVSSCLLEITVVENSLSSPLFVYNIGSILQVFKKLQNPLLKDKTARSRAVPLR
jgi:hypothetical protein